MTYCGRARRADEIRSIRGGGACVTSKALDELLATLTDESGA